MSELRQDPTTFDWVIIAEERAKRPHEFKRKWATKHSLPAFSENCPFCPGNEGRTPEPEAVYGSEDTWSIRVVPNKFAALTPSGDTKREEWKSFRKGHGYGKHEIVVETPLHNKSIAFMRDEHVEELIRAYRDRYRALRQDPAIKIIVIF